MFGCGDGLDPVALIRCTLQSSTFLPLFLAMHGCRDSLGGLIFVKVLRVRSYAEVVIGCEDTFLTGFWLFLFIC